MAMANDEEWVSDVRRWCREGGASGPGAAGLVPEDPEALLGYEAALPPLQARHWPDASPVGDDRRS